MVRLLDLLDLLGVQSERTPSSGQREQPLSALSPQPASIMGCTIGKNVFSVLNSQ